MERRKVIEVLLTQVLAALVGGGAGGGAAYVAIREDLATLKTSQRYSENRVEMVDRRLDYIQNRIDSVAGR